MTDDTPSTMKRLVVKEPGKDVASCKIEVESDVPVPEPRNGEVLIRVVAAPINPSDRRHSGRRGEADLSHTDRRGGAPVDDPGGAGGADVDLDPGVDPGAGSGSGFGGREGWGDRAEVRRLGLVPRPLLALIHAIIGNI